MLMLPCFWPHMIIVSPFLYIAKIAAENSIKSTYWILTEHELKIVVMKHNLCLPGCCRVGDTVQSIPLDAITDCGSTAPIMACSSCSCDVPTIYIDTASSGRSKNGPKHEAVGYGMAGHDWFMSEILSRRSARYQERSLLFLGSIGTNMMDRGNTDATESSSFENRIHKLIELQKLDLITEKEYEAKRLEIIASI